MKLKNNTKQRTIEDYAITGYTMFHINLNAANKGRALPSLSIAASKRPQQKSNLKLITKRCAWCKSNCVVMIACSLVVSIEAQQ